MSDVSKVESQSKARELYDFFQRTIIGSGNVFLLDTCEHLTKNYEQIP